MLSEYALMQQLHPTYCFIGSSSAEIHNSHRLILSAKVSFSGNDKRKLLLTHLHSVL